MKRQARTGKGSGPSGAVRIEDRSAPVIVRAGRSRADRLARASAVLVGRPFWSAANLDPTEQLRKLDLYFLMLWHCRRALDDFWGPPPEQDCAAILPNGFAAVS